MEYSIVSARDFNTARKEIKKAEGKVIFSGDDETGKKILEKEKIDILLISQAERKDRLKQRDSGFDEVMAKLAKKNNVTIGINLDELIESDKKNKAEIIARVKQNIELCKKNKVKMKFIALKTENQRDIYDLKALGLTLGMPTLMVKEL